MIERLFEPAYWLLMSSLLTAGVIIGYCFATIPPHFPASNTLKKSIHAIAILLSLFSIYLIFVQIRSNMAVNFLSEHGSEFISDQWLVNDFSPFLEPREDQFPCFSTPRNNKVRSKSDDAEFCRWRRIFARINAGAPTRLAKAKLPPLPNKLPPSIDNVPKAFPNTITSLFVGDVKAYDRQIAALADAENTVQSKNSPKGLLISAIIAALTGGIALARVFWYGKLSYR